MQLRFLRDRLPAWLGGEKPRIELMLIRDDERQRVVAFRVRTIRIRPTEFSKFVTFWSLRLTSRSITSGGFHRSRDCAVFFTRVGYGQGAEPVLASATETAAEIQLAVERVHGLTVTEALSNPELAGFDLMPFADLLPPPTEVTQLIPIDPPENT